MNDYQAIDQFCAAMRAQGIETDDEIIGDGVIHRIHVKGDRAQSKNGWYCLHLDESPAANFGCNKRHGSHKFSWTAKRDSKPMTPEERDAMRQRTERQRAEKLAAETARHAAASERANALWASSRDANDSHPYLTRKQVKQHGLKVGRWEVINQDTGEIRLISDNALLVPLYDRGRKLHNLQAIFPKKLMSGGTRDKDYMKDGEKIGLFFPIGKPLSIDGKRLFIICEGYATGASIHEATGHCVIVTFDTSNLLPVAQSIRERQPDAIIVFAADNDQFTLTPIENPGVHYANAAANAVGGIVVVPSFFNVDDKPTDFNDLHTYSGLDAVREQVLAPFAPAPAEKPVHIPEPEPVQQQPETPAPMPDASSALPPDEGFDELTKNKFFSILGYDHGHYYLFMHEKLQVISLTKGDLSDIGLIEIAPANFWEEHFPGKTGIDRKAAADWLFRSANARGIYDPARVRGRGAWVDKLDDKSRYVFHHGSHLTVDGERVGIAHIKSAYVYPRGRTMPEPDFDNPLTDSQGMWLLGVLKKARWCMPGSAALLAGWTMLAPVCGALKWRSHIWMAGPAGSGKSTLQEMFCGSLLAGICIPAQGNSTEAGIRQRLKADAIPVLLDEAESNNEREKQRVENILSLIRQSSTESRAETLKGTVSGESMHFHVRSMFCLASINTLLDKQADIDRLTRLSLMKPTKSSDVSQWESLSEDLHKITTDDTLPPKLLARALRLLPVIHQNIAVFTKAAAQFFGTQRMGDQFGTLLAGAWSLISTEPATPATALRMIESFNWTEHTEDSSQDDSMRALEAVLGAKIRMPMSIGEITVFELIRETSMSLRQGLCDEVMALNTLRRHGIVIEQFDGKSVVLFGTTVSNLIHLVEKTPFASDLKGQLLRVAGSSRFYKPVSFNGLKSRCVAIPISAILDEVPPPIDDYPL